MIPIIESLRGLKALNDQFIAADILQDLAVRMELLTTCLGSGDVPELHPILEQQLLQTLQLQLTVKEYCERKQWVTNDHNQQWDNDLKWAYKAIKLAGNDDFAKVNK